MGQVSYDAHGYDDLRSYAFNNHNWLAFVDDTGTELIRWDLQSNSNVTVVSDASSNPIEYDVEVTGQDLIDAGYSLPVTIEKLELHLTSSATTPLATQLIEDSDGNDTTATLEASTDTMGQTFQIPIPP
jgi:hypothetical protein